MTKKENIAAHSFRLFIDSGIGDVSVNDIVGSARITKGCFYHYYSSKDELIYEIFKTYILEYFEDLFIKVRSSRLSPKERLRLLCSLLLGYEDYLKEIFKDDSISFSKIFSLIVEGSKKFEYMMEFRKKVFDEACALAASILETAREGNPYGNDGDPKALAFKIMLLNEGLMSLKMIKKEINIKKLAEENADELFNSFCKQVIL
ncbi:MAG: TetR/AcrR family transcriptional regulator [Lachnospiraceae bacterium]|nr:TetR/AcrR family transcriptional regulator [Lachnospiraceae bacterium]